MSARLTSAMLVSAMLRRIGESGGAGMVLAKGDATAGAILVALAERGITHGLVERALGADGYALVPTGPADLAAPGAISDYIERRRGRDPDLWVVELEGAAAAGIARDTIG